MKIYLLFIRSGGIVKLEGVFSTSENAENEVEEGEVYCIVPTELDRCAPFKLEFIVKR